MPSLVHHSFGGTYPAVAAAGELWPMAHRAILGIFAILLGALALATAVSADATGTGRRCTLSVVVQFAAGPSRPAPRTLARIARANALTLAFVREVGGGLHLYRLGAAGDDAACTAALLALRRDPRIQSIDPDNRRQAH